MNAPTNNIEVIIEKDSKGELTISLKEEETYKSLTKTKESVELIISQEQWRQIQDSTLEIAMKIIKGLYCDNLEKVNYQ